MKQFTLSVVVPCRNEARFISACLDSLLDSDFPKGNIEILVVDGLSDDGTRDIVNKYQLGHSNIKMIDNPEGITPVALNLGVTNASGNLIMIASAHSTFPPAYIPRLVEKLDELKADVVGGGMETIPGSSTPVAMSIAAILSDRVGVGDSRFRTGAAKPLSVDTVPFGIYRSEAFKDAGNYNERLIRNHDIELSKRMIRKGKKIFLIPEIRCAYFARDTFSELARNNYRNGYWNILTLYITGMFSSLSFRHYVPLAFLLSLTLPLAIGTVVPAFYFIPPLIFILYNLLVIYKSYRLKGSKTGIFLLLQGFYVLHFSYGTGSLAGLFRLDKLFVRK